MALAFKKFNPGFLTDEEIKESFCVRTNEFDSIVEVLRENTGNSNTHSIVIGPRGSGKTHLLLRTAAEVRRNASLAGLFPVVFAEESYEVSTCGEFWLECLGRLAEQAPIGERENLRLTYNDLRTIGEDKTLADRCLGSLLDFADRQQRRLLLLVENMNMLFSETADPDAGWQLRKILQTEPLIMLLGSATSRFEEIDSYEHALYGLFRIITLRPLGTGECEVLWQSVTGKPSTQGAVRPLEILTGGNPRLLTVIARFGADMSFPDLWGNLLDLVDDHTEYFKSHLESLPPRERRVYLALARLWKPASTKEVANLARMDTNRCSSLLGRLVERGAVVIDGGTERRREYYLTERLYNIYYLLRRSGGSDHVVEALMEFMTCLYSRPGPGEVLAELTGLAPPTYPLPADSVPMLARSLLTEAAVLLERGQTDESSALYDQVIQSLGTEESVTCGLIVAAALIGKVMVHSSKGHFDKVIGTFDDLAKRYSNQSDPAFREIEAKALLFKGRLLVIKTEPGEALKAFQLALRKLECSKESEFYDFQLASITCEMGRAYVLNQQMEKALQTFEQVVDSLRESEEPQLRTVLADALTGEVVATLELDQDIHLCDLRLLLETLAKLDKLPQGFLDLMRPLLKKVSTTRVLELIQASPANSSLLPLVTSLQQELGQRPRVAKEVEEVARDMRDVLYDPEHSR